MLVTASTLFNNPRDESTHGHHQMSMTKLTKWSISKSDYVLCSQRWRSSIQSLKTRPGTDCGSNHELLIAKLKVKLNKVESPWTGDPRGL